MFNFMRNCQSIFQMAVPFHMEYSFKSCLLVLIILIVKYYYKFIEINFKEEYLSQLHMALAQ